MNKAMRAEHMLAVPAGDNVVRLLPPLTVTDAEIRLAVDRIRSAAAALTPAAESAA
jgi:acetylornithine/N-succinyldiaminopimelate aminotransferase